jgi:hypothetical protein
MVCLKSIFKGLAATFLGATANVLGKKFEQSNLSFAVIIRMYIAAVIIGIFLGFLLYVILKRKNDILVMTRFRYCIIYSIAVFGIGMSLFSYLYIQFIMIYPAKFTVFVPVWFITCGFVMTNVLYTIKQHKEKKQDIE